MNISIFASIGCQNLGDELILKNEILLLRERYGENVQFRVFSYDIHHPFFEDENIQYIEYFPIDIRNIKNIFRNIGNCFSFLTTLLWSDLVVIGGGGLFYEHEIQSSRSPLDIWEYRMGWIKFFRKKVLFFSVGIDVVSPDGLLKLQEIFGYKKATITVRDTESFCTLKNLGIESEVVKDPVFSEESSEIRGEILGAFSSDRFSTKDLEKYDFSDKKVGVALRKGYIGSMKNERLSYLMVEEILSMIEKQGGSIVFLPHSFHMTDALANDKVFLDTFMKPNRIIKTSIQEVYIAYKNKEIDICLSMRLHSIILSHMYGIDSIALSYSKKTDQVLKKLSR